MTYTERLHRKGIPFSGFKYIYERVEISLVGVYERILSFRLVKSPKRAYRCITCLWKELSKRSGFAIYSYFKDSAYTAAKRDAML